MYTPEGIITPTRPTLRLGIMGEPGTGKTFSALTFPNPVVLDFDHKVPVKPGVVTVPFWDEDWVDDYIKKNGATRTDMRPNIGMNKRGPCNVREGVRLWLERNAKQLSADQTLVLDSWTLLQCWFDRVTWAEPDFASRKGDSVYDFYRCKAMYAQEVLDYLKGAKCMVVVTFHEIDKKEKVNGVMEFRGRLRPLMDGQFAAQLPGHFTDWYRMEARDKKDAAGNKLGMTEYYWQLKPDDVAACNTSFITNKARIPATYTALLAEMKASP